MSDLVFGGTGNVGHLFVYDPASGTSTDLGQAVSGQTSILDLLLAPDGYVYGVGGAYAGEGHLFRFLPSSPGTVVDLGVPVAGSSELGDLTLGADGLIYGATADQNLLFSYDPATGEVKVRGAMAGVSRIDSLCTGPGGVLYGGGFPSGRLFSYNPVTGQSADLGAPLSGEYTIEAVVAGPDGKVYGGTRYARGHLFAYDVETKTWTLFGAPVWQDTSLISLVVGGDGWLYGGTGTARGRLFRFDPLARPHQSSGVATTVAIAPRMVHEDQMYVPGTSEVEALAVTADGWVYASGYGASGNAKLSRWNPAGDDPPELLGNVPGWPSAVYDLLPGPDGKIYGGGGSYGTSPVFFRYDPVVGVLEYLGYGLANENYIYALALCSNGRIYAAIGSNGAADGVILQYNPADGTYAVFEPIIVGESSIRSLICTPGDVLYGGTSPNGHLFRFHPMGGVADLGQPVPGETRVSALALGADGLIYGGTEGSGRLFSYDPATSAFADLGRPFALDTQVHDLDVGPDGLVYGVTGSAEGHLFVYDPAIGLLSDLGKVYNLERHAYSLILGNSAEEIYIGTGYNYGYLVAYRLGYDFAWQNLTYQVTVPGSTGLTVDVLDPAGTPLLTGLPSGAPLWSLSSSTTPAIQLRANLSTSQAALTPSLLEWSVTWTVSPVLAIEPAMLSFQAPVGGPDPLPQSLFLDNPNGSGLAWSVSGLPAWLSVEPASGDVPSTLSVSVAVDGLDAGLYTATLLFAGPPDCANCPVELPVQVEMYDVPALAVTPNHLDLEAVQGQTVPLTAQVAVDNVGTGVLPWTAAADVPWLALDPASGEAPSTLQVTADPSALAAGVHTGLITVSGPPDCANCPQVVTATLTVEPPPLLEVTPPGVELEAALGGADPAPVTLSLANAGGGQLPWSLSGLPAWLSAEPLSGTAPSTLILTATVQGLAAGVYPATLQFGGPPDCANCPLDLPVQLTIYDVPALAVTPASLAFEAFEGETIPRTDDLSVDNVGTGVLTWTASADVPWLAVAPGSGASPPEATVGVASDPSGLPAGVYSGQITVSGPPDCANCPKIVPVTLTVEPPPVLQVEPVSVDLLGAAGGDDPAPVALTITNLGGGVLSWQAATDVAWLSAEPPSGLEGDPLWLRVDLAGLAPGAYVGHLTVTESTGLADPVQVPVRLTLRRVVRLPLIPRGR